MRSVCSARWNSRSRKTLVPEFDRLFKTLTAQQKEFWEAMAKPKASRRPTLAKEYMETTQGLLDTLDKLSGTLAANVNHQDATIDQLLAIKQIAWLLRNTAGEASLLISNGLAAGKRLAGNPPHLHQIRRRHRDRLERAGTDRRGHAIAAGACRPRWPPPRPPISNRNISPCATAC